MSWLQLSVSIPADMADKVEEIFTEHQALSTSFTAAQGEMKPLFHLTPNENTLWEQVTITALFDADYNPQPLLQHLAKQGIAANDIQQQPLAEKNWVAETQKQFHCQRFGQGLWVCPSWETPPSEAQTPVIIDPGLAFGTGTHPTTQLCLQWLAEHPPQQYCVVDYGCGSGILSLAALALGATKVYAIDHDPQAIDATKHNMTLNPFASSHNLICQLTPPTDNLAADLIIANILANPLRELYPQFMQFIKPNGQLILSGILNSEIEQVCQHYRNHCVIESVAQHDEWGLIVARKQA